jgi:hypothetical protein
VLSRSCTLEPPTAAPAPLLEGTAAGPRETIVSFPLPRKILEQIEERDRIKERAGFAPALSR